MPTAPTVNRVRPSAPWSSTRCGDGRSPDTGDSADGLGSLSPGDTSRSPKAGSVQFPFTGSAARGGVTAAGAAGGERATAKGYGFPFGAMTAFYNGPWRRFTTLGTHGC